MLQDFYDKIVAIQEFDIEKEVDNIINSNQEYLTGLIKDQLAQGIDGAGKSVTVFGSSVYSTVTIQRKKYLDGLAGETRWITNYMSGQFYANMNVKATGQIFQFSSDVPYLEAILEQSGDVILELDQKHLQQFADEILYPQLQEAWDLKIAGF